MGLEGWVMAYDGMPLDKPEKVNGEFPLAPGQRVDLFVDVTAEEGEAAYLLRTIDEQLLPQAAFPVTARSSVSTRDAPQPLPPNHGEHITDVSDATAVTLRMEGGAMGRLNTAVLDGEEMTFRQLAEANQFWSFNGVVGMTETPLAGFSRGEMVKLKIENETRFPHAMHLHGMHFREVLEDGQFGPMRDTILTYAGRTTEIAFRADNPGKWLFHCHMLSHSAAGMRTWIDVA